MKIYQVDAFTGTPFAGNPAAVCVLESEKPDAWMAALAAEMNLSETAFLRETGDVYSLRWFTPATEVSLCGHATLASAHILWERGYVAARSAISFSTLSGELRASRHGDRIELDFPAREIESSEENAVLNEALGASPSYTGTYPMGGTASSSRGPLYLLELESAAAVRELSPDFRRLLATGAGAAIVTAASTDGRHDFVSRFFAPAAGIDEDPVTGSAHCYLAPYWSRKLGKAELVGLQVSKRTGVVGCRLNGDRVLLRGRAVTVLVGDVLV